MIVQGLDMRTTKAISYTVQTATMGTREVVFRGRDAEKTAKVYEAMWAAEGHTVTRH